MDVGVEPLNEFFFTSAAFAAWAVSTFTAPVIASLFGGAIIGHYVPKGIERVREFLADVVYTINAKEMALTGGHPHTPTQQLPQNFQRQRARLLHQAKLYIDKTFQTSINIQDLTDIIDDAMDKALDTYNPMVAQSFNSRTQDPTTRLKKYGIKADKYWKPKHQTPRNNKSARKKRNSDVLVVSNQTIR